ncbi:HET-domain-containing protein [Stipitochalara longipes BDJ]|nr:HET-domain-containing protein [Stipitochalara longipes BDJ]
MRPAVTHHHYAFDPELSHLEPPPVIYLGSETSGLKCDLQHFPLHECPPYMALSYVWGDSLTSLPLQVNSGFLTIGKNLASFLEQVRAYIAEPTAPQYCWADTVCINQADTLERNKQVLRMKEIYERAASVIMWLGDRAENSERAMNLITTLESIKLSENPDDISDKPIDPELFLYEGEPFTNDDWIAVRELLNHPYWGRAWILQEASTPESLQDPKDAETRLVWCEDYSLPFRSFLRANQCLNGAMFHTGTEKFPRILNSLIFEVVHCWFKRTVNNPLDLVTLLPIMRGKKATNPSDKLYAMLAIAADGNHDELRPNYDLPVEEIYTNFAFYMMKHNRNLDILGFCTSNGEFPQLLSWVPDWTGSRLPHTFYSSRRQDVGSFSALYSASGDKVPSLTLWPDDSAQALKLGGIFFDTISEVSLPRTEFVGEERDLMSNWAQWAYRGDGAVIYIAGGTRREALSHVLCADSLGEGRRDGSIPWSEGDEVNNVYWGSFWKLTQVHCVTAYRRLIYTRKGYLGIASWKAEVGDTICVLVGGQMPFVLKEQDGHYIMIGECYIHGIMDGEGVPKLKTEVEEEASHYIV